MKHLLTVTLLLLPGAVGCALSPLDSTPGSSAKGAGLHTRTWHVYRDDIERGRPRHDQRSVLTEGQELFVQFPRTSKGWRFISGEPITDGDASAGPAFIIDSSSWSDSATAPQAEPDWFSYSWFRFQTTGRLGDYTLKFQQDESGLTYEFDTAVRRPEWTRLSIRVLSGTSEDDAVPLQCAWVFAMHGGESLPVGGPTDADGRVVFQLPRSPHPYRFELTEGGEPYRISTVKGGSPGWTHGSWNAYADAATRTIEVLTHHDVNIRGEMQSAPECGRSR